MKTLSDTPGNAMPRGAVRLPGPELEVFMSKFVAISRQPEFNQKTGDRLSTPTTWNFSQPA
jgi:hypothetical protein